MAFDLRLDGLELTNYRKFAHYSINFDENLTVLVGDNGSGKSSVLAAAATALDSVVFNLIFSHQSRIGRSDARVDIFDMGDVMDRQEQYPVIVSARGAVGGADDITWSCRLNSPDGRAEDESELSFTRIMQDCSKRVKGGDSELVLPVVASYGTNRLWAGNRGGRDLRQGVFSRQDGYRGALDAHAGEDQMLAWFFKMTAQDVQRAQGIKPMEKSELFTAVRGAVERCFQAITGSSQVKVFYNLDTADLDVEYVDQDGEVRRMSMGLLSDGYRTTLSMVADIAYRMALLNPALGERVLEETPGVVLIDEVDLHLHPLWQARILADLRDIFPRVQFIVTTHAPVVISSVTSSHIRLLGDGDEAREPVSEIYGSDVGRVLISVMGASERLPKVQKKFDEFYRVLDGGDFARAKVLLEELKSTVGSDDTGFVGAQTALALEEADARYVAN